MKNKKHKLKFKKKQIIIISSVLLLIVIALIIGLNTGPNVGKIKNGKAKYINRVANVTKYEDSIIIEFENSEELIDNCIITTKIYDKFKSNDPLYSISVKDYAKLSTLTAKESYNINKAMQMGIVREDETYSDYFAKTCGFKNKKELLKYIEAVFELTDKEK